MAFEQLKISRATVPLNKRSVWVSKPVEPIHRFQASGRANAEWHVLGDSQGFRQLSLWALLAADLDDEIMWIPKSGDRFATLQSGFEACDLVLCHHKLQLRPSHWKEARSYFQNEKLQTRSVTTDRETTDPEQFQRMKAPPGEDVADFHLHANTVFITGSKLVFRILAEAFSDLQHAKHLGDHTHLFKRARDEWVWGQMGDVYIGYIPEENWA
jgi:hypothetical protein